MVRFSLVAVLGVSHLGLNASNLGTLDVTVLGDSLPISFKNKFFIVFAILRQLHLAFTLLYRTYFTSSFIPPDIYIVDQLSTCIPILRWFARTRVIFYCHFPDLLLSPGRGGFENGMIGRERKSFLRSLYRLPIDQLEEATTGECHHFPFLFVVNVPCLIAHALLISRPSGPHPRKLQLHRYYIQINLPERQEAIANRIPRD